MEQKKFVLSITTLIQLLVFIVLVPLLPILLSGRWGWWEAWIYAAISIFGFTVSRYLAAQKHPDLLQERAKAFTHQDAAAWDKVLSPLLALGGGLLPLVAGLNARWGVSAGFSVEVTVGGLIAILIGYILGSWALIVNRYFSGMVRIQHDRGHQVITKGPYRYVRHPGYVGVLFAYLGTPLLLNSSWAFFPMGLLFIVVIIRTSLEDRTLHEQLPGYREYAKTVPSRLIPGIW